MLNKIRKFLWRILGFDYQMLLKKTDFVLLGNDCFTQKGIRTYDNGAKVWRWTNAPINIGKYCSIAHNVNFIVDEGFHKISSITNFPLAKNMFKDESLINGLEKKTYFSKFKQKEGIFIGNDVWIGMGVFIMPGVTIGNGVTIAANSVVTEDISDYVLVAGSPAKVVREKYNKLLIQKLNKIAWWHWDEILIKNRIDDFHNGIEFFVDKYYQK